jgi:hypothetical protein
MNECAGVAMHAAKERETSVIKSKRKKIMFEDPNLMSIAFCS